MVERTGDSCLLLEAAKELDIGRDDLGHDLQGDVTAESGVPGAVDLRHAAGAEHRQHLVGAES
jgi:hypothetical protein